MARRVIVFSQPGWMFCQLTKEFLSQNHIPFADRDVTKDPSALGELRKLGYMTTPVIQVDDEVVVGFDEDRLRKLLGLWFLSGDGRGG